MNITEEQFKRTITKRFLKKLKSELMAEEQDDDALLQTILNSINDNSYFPKNPIYLLSYNKGCGVLRYVPLLAQEDYIVYAFCVSAIDELLAEHRVEGTYGGWTLSCAMRKKEQDDAEDDISDNLACPPSPCSNTFNRKAYIQHFGEYNTRVKERLEYFAANENMTIVKIDIANFYDCIRLDLLECAIREAVPNGYSEIVNCLFFFLRNWNRRLHSYRPQSVGLPQEYIGDCSRILANFYLQGYDAKMKEECEKRGGKYLRFADDQIFFIENTSVEQIMAISSYQLSTIGLNINIGKVRVFKNVNDYKVCNALGLSDTLVSDLLPKEQPNYNKDCYARAFLELDRTSLPKRGFSFAKTIVHMGISNLSVANQADFIKVLIEEYIGEQFDKRLLQELREHLGEKWDSFAKLLIKSISNDIQNIRRFELLKCGQELGLDVDWISTANLETEHVPFPPFDET